MSQLNRPAIAPDVRTHGGVPAYPHMTPLQRLRRSVLSCLLWEDEFYEDGVAIADRIAEAAKGVTREELAALAIEARTSHNLRHVPLLLLCELVAKGGGRIVGDTIATVIQRADEIPELLAMYWRHGKRPLSKQLKVGLARAFHKFDAYQLAKYDRDRAVKLRDALFLAHPRAASPEQDALWKQLVDGTLPSPDTWEVALSSGAEKRESFERLLAAGKLGYLALLRNLRKMTEVGVPVDTLREAILARKGARRVLPFRYVAAARACPQLDGTIDLALGMTIEEMPVLSGKTGIYVDVSGSMDAPLSGKSDLRRMEAAATLASVVHAERLRVFTFSDRTVEVAPRRGLAGVDAVVGSQAHSGTDLAGAIRHANKMDFDRVIVVTDEQAATGRPPDPVAPLAYMVNVASYKNGIGYGKWLHLDGFSEQVIRWIHEYERASDIG